MLKLSRVLTFGVIFLFLLQGLFAGDCEFSINKAQIYSDSQDFELVIKGFGFNKMDDFSGIKNYAILNNVNIDGANKLTSSEFSITYKILGLFNNSSYTYTIFVAETPCSYSITPLSGTPAFNLFVVGENTGEGSKFNNQESISAYIEGAFNGTKNFDNPDDGLTSVTCTMSLPGMENKVLTISDTNTSRVDFGVITLLPNEGAKELKVNCSDGVLESEKTKIIERIDAEPEIQMSFNPLTIKPNTLVKSSVKITDEDTDLKEYAPPTYKWTKNAVDTKITASEFDCAKQACKAGDTINCEVAYLHTYSDKTYSSNYSAKVASLLSNVDISAPTKAQLGEELSLQATFNYSGKETLKYTWSFGDGTTSTTQNPKKTYTKKGKYSINLTITDNKGSTESVSHSIEIVDADISLTIKNPLVNQEFNKGEKIKVLANITDNTGSPIEAKVSAGLYNPDKNFPKINLTKVTGTINSFEGEIELDYLSNEISEIKFDANYVKGKLSLKTSKTVPIGLISTDAINPEIELITKFPEGDNSLSVGNTIESVILCFRLPNNKLDDAFSNAKMILEASETIEFELEEVEDKCYIINTNYRVKSLDYDTKITFKFKDAKDDFGNYVKLSKKIEYDVIEGQDVFDIVLIEPKINKTNYGQKIFVNAKYILKENYIDSKLTNLKAWIEYKGKTYNLENFKGYFMPENEPKINFKVVFSGLYDDKLIEKEISKSLDVTNELKVELISPNESGVIKSSGEIILAIKYQNDALYDAESITLYFEDKNYIFNRIDSGSNEGYFSTDYDDVGILKSTILNFKGSDIAGNTFLINKEIPTMSLLVPLYIYYILFGIVLVLVILTISITSLSSKQKAFSKELQGKSFEQLQDDLEVEKRILGDLKRKYFKQEINETEFKMKKTEVESKISVLESKIANEMQKENKHLEQGKDYLDNNANQKQILEKRFGFENNVYTQYKQDIDTLTYKLKPFKDKYTAEEMRLAIKQGKNLPENVIDKIIEKIYN